MDEHIGHWDEDYTIRRMASGEVFFYPGKAIKAVDGSKVWHGLGLTRAGSNGGFPPKGNSLAHPLARHNV